MKDVAVPDNMLIGVEVISDKNVESKTWNYNHEFEGILPPKDQS